MEQTVRTLLDLKKGVLTERSKDLFLALLIAIIGLAGSYLVLGKSIKEPVSYEQLNNPETIYDRYQYHHIKDLEYFKNGNYQFHEEDILIQGNMLVGGIIRITNLKFDQNKSYYIDFGNGNQHRMTSAVMSMRYNSPGLYLVQCYILEDKKWNLISAETITIRKDGNNNI